MRADSTEIRRDVEALRRASRDENLDIRVIQLAVHEWLSQSGTAFPLRSRLVSRASENCPVADMKPAR